MRNQAQGFTAPEGRTWLSDIASGPHLRLIMTNTEMTGAEKTATAAIAPKKIQRISIAQRSGVWRIAIDGKFYGDYVREQWAREAALEKAHNIAARGGAARISLIKDQGHENLLHDTSVAKPRERIKRVKPQRQVRWPLILGESLAPRLCRRTPG